jgi:hypothetical protein
MNIDRKIGTVSILLMLLCGIVSAQGVSSRENRRASSSDLGRRQYKLGGAWAGHSESPSWTWTALQIPTNPEGTEAALLLKFTSYGADVAGLVASFGADFLSDFVGQEVMIDRDTARWTLVGYAQAKGPNNELQIRAIVVAFGTLQFTGPNVDVIHATLTVYPAAADANGDGLPDPGAAPVLTIPDIVETGRRVPMLQ